MTFTADPTTDIGKVRLLITDTDDSRQIFSDEELSAFLSLTGSAVFLAAAQALDTIASSTAMTQQHITILGLATNGPSVAAELRARAQQLRADHRTIGGTTPAFGSAEFADDHFQREELYWKTLQRQGLL